MSPSAMLATQSEGRCRQAPATQTAAASTASTGTQARRQSLPSAISARLPRRMPIGVAKCHACHAECTSTSPRATCHTNSRGVHGINWDPSARPEPAQWHKCTCHAECTSMSPSATPATQSEGRCRQVPRLPRKVKVNVAKRHACHTNSSGDNGPGTQERQQSQPSSTSATPAAKPARVACE